MTDQAIIVTDEGEDIGETESVSTFERRALDSLITHVAVQIGATVATFDNEIQSEIDKLLEATRASERENTARIQSIRAARKEIAGRSIIVALLLGACGFALYKYQPNLLTILWAALPEWMAHGVMVGVTTSVVVGVPFALLSFALVGISNPAAKTACSSITRVRLSTWWLRRKQRKELSSFVGKALQAVPSGIGALDGACLTAIIQWIQNENAELVEVQKHLAEARQKVSQRAQTISGLVTTITPSVTNLPNYIQERSESIREAAIAEHMAAIREAADSVEALRANISRIAKNTELSAPCEYFERMLVIAEDA